MTAPNVGTLGGDLAARRFAFLATITLAILPLPSLALSASTLKLASLSVSMIGILFLIAGLVFLQKTHFAGIMLIPSASAIMAVTQMGSPIGASLIGLTFSAAIAWSTRSSRPCAINQLLGIDSSDSGRTPEAKQF